MMKKIYILIFPFVVLMAVHAQEAEVVVLLAGENAVYGRQLLTDGKNVYVTGEYSGVFSPGNDIRLESSVRKPFVAKYLPDGTCEWAKNITDDRLNDISLSSSVDENGKLFVLVTSGRGSEVYIFSPDGNLEMPVGFSDSQVRIGDITVTGGTMYVCGQLSDELFVGAYSLTGEKQWEIMTGAEEQVAGKKVIADDYGNVFVSGEYNNASSGKTDLLVSKISGGGHIVWSRKIYGNRNESVSDMAFLPDGSLVLSGTTKSSQLTIDGVSCAAQSAGAQHIMCLCLNGNGESRWLYTAGASQISSPSAAASMYVSESGDIYLGGYCSGKVIFNPQGENHYNLPDKEGKDAVMIKLTGKGEVCDVKRFGNTTDERLDDLVFASEETMLYCLYNFNGRTQYGTYYATTDINMSGRPYPLEAVGRENNSVLAGYRYIRVYADHVDEAVSGEPYRACLYHQGGSRKVVYTLTEGRLPEGLSLSPEGDITGIPVCPGISRISIKGTDERGNSFTVAFDLKVVCNSSIFSVEKPGHRGVCYPNPARNYISVDPAYAAGETKICIVNMQGALVKTVTLPDVTTGRINVSDLPVGVYFVRCMSVQGIYSEKLIRQ